MIPAACRTVIADFIKYQHRWIGRVPKAGNAQPGKDLASQNARVEKAIARAGQHQFNLRAVGITALRLQALPFACLMLTYLPFSIYRKISRRKNTAAQEFHTQFLLGPNSQPRWWCRQRCIIHMLHAAIQPDDALDVGTGFGKRWHTLVLIDPTFPGVVGGRTRR